MKQKEGTWLAFCYHEPVAQVLLEHRNFLAWLSGLSLLNLAAQAELSLKLGKCMQIKYRSKKSGFVQDANVIHVICNSDTD